MHESLWIRFGLITVLSSKHWRFLFAQDRSQSYLDWYFKLSLRNIISASNKYCCSDEPLQTPQMARRDEPGGHPFSGKSSFRLSRSLIPLNYVSIQALLSVFRYPKNMTINLVRIVFCLSSGSHLWQYDQTRGLGMWSLQDSQVRLLLVRWFRDRSNEVTSWQFINSPHLNIPIHWMINHVTLAETFFGKYYSNHLAELELSPDKHGIVARPQTPLAQELSPKTSKLQIQIIFRFVFSSIFPAKLEIARSTTPFVAPPSHTGAYGSDHHLLSCPPQGVGHMSIAKNYVPEPSGKINFP